MSKKRNIKLLIDLFINRIYLYDDKLIITYNHKDGAKAITLEDIEIALAEAGYGLDLVSAAVPIKDGANDRFTPSFIYTLEEGTRKIKCGADERHSRCLDPAKP